MQYLSLYLPSRSKKLWFGSRLKKRTKAMPFTKDENGRMLSEIRDLMSMFHVAMGIQTTFVPASTGG